MKTKLLKRIERMRKKLHRIGLNRRLIDPEVVEVSQQLDALLNQYYEIGLYQQLSFWH
jgi:hypothetical protein